MKFLLDENLPPSLCVQLSEIGHEAIHVRQCGLTGAPDLEIVNYTKAKQLCIITHDLDFSRIISLSGLDKPSVITLRHEKIGPQILLNVLTSQIPHIESILENGALVTIDEDKIRYRLLPLSRQE